MAYDQEALNTVLDFIHGGFLDGAEREIYDAIRDRRGVQAVVARGSFRIGDHVTFNDEARKLRGLSGVVIRKLQKNIVVLIDDTPAAQRKGYAGVEFRCHPALMEHVQEEVVS